MTETSEIRNVGLIGHVGTGKTSFADAILFNAGQNTRLGKVDHETSLMDYEPEEMKRKTTISSAIASFSWKKQMDKSCRHTRLGKLYCGFQKLHAGNRFCTYCS